MKTVVDEAAHLAAHEEALPEIRSMYPSTSRGTMYKIFKKMFIKGYELELGEHAQSHDELLIENLALSKRVAELENVIRQTNPKTAEAMASPEYLKELRSEYKQDKPLTVIIDELSEWFYRNGAKDPEIAILLDKTSHGIMSKTFRGREWKPKETNPEIKISGVHACNTIVDVEVRSEFIEKYRPESRMTYGIEPHGPSMFDLVSVKDKLTQSDKQDIDDKFTNVVNTTNIKAYESFLVAKDFFEKGYLASYMEFNNKKACPG